MRTSKSSITNIGNNDFGVPNTGRRGEPLPGCDCMRCFGYCIYDQDQAQRERALQADQKWQGEGLDLSAMWEDR